MSVDTHTCETTGIALLPAARQTMYRLAKPSYGPLNPQRRTVSSADDRTSWNRYDLPGEQTIYAASSPEGAYGELLGSLKKPTPIRAAKYVDDAGGANIEELIASDWAAAGKKLAPYTVDLNWLYEFQLYTFTIAPTGWFADIEHSRTVGYLEQHIPTSLWERGQHRVTVAELRGPDRFVTTSLAEQLAKAQLNDGSKPVGLRYGSKHGSDWDCWTLWLRSGVKASIDVDDGISIAHPDRNPVLAKVLETYNLTI